MARAADSKSRCNRCTAGTLMDILSTLDRPEAVFARQTVRLYQRIVEACAERNLPMSEPVLLGDSPKTRMCKRDWSYRGTNIGRVRCFRETEVLAL